MSHSGIAQYLSRLWYRRPLSLVLLPLLPLSWLFRGLSALRRARYRTEGLPSRRLTVPVIVIGNLTVGGSGKTPLVIWVVEQLRARGWSPGVISRGYGSTGDGVRPVLPDSAASEVGDEPLLIARRCAVPVFVGVDRVTAGEALLSAESRCNVIVSDDGLQHFRLQRSVEIVVFDGRGAGNGQMLPAGPLREPLARLASVTAVVWNSAPEGQFDSLSVPQFSMRLEADRFYALVDAARRCSAEDLRGRRLFALAGIGDPARFFAQLSALGLEFEAHPFPDHHVYTAADLAFARSGTLLMTEKDAVKCATLSLHEVWVLPVAAQLDVAADGRSLTDLLLENLDGCPPA